jgi:uncharacterized protein Yka (UPF0111/DUF47 family)
MQLSVEIAVEARKEFLLNNVNNVIHYPIIVASLGPYGAALADGSEYTGYHNVSLSALTSFHAERLHVMLNTQADILAFETIPCLSEANAIKNLLHQYSTKKAWISFSCKDGLHLCSGELFEDAVKLLNNSIKKGNEDPKVKFDKIKQNIINNFNRTISPELQKNFTEQLMALIKNVDELVKLYRTLGCKVNMIWQYNCPPEIQEKINAISQIKIKMETDKEIFLREIKQIFGKFHSKTVGIYALAINTENYEKKIEEMEQKIQEIQDNIITEVTEKHTVIIKAFQQKLKLINDNIEQLSNASSSVLNVQSVQPTPVQPIPVQSTAGGRRRKYKTRRNKKNKTSKSKKRKRSRKRI